MDNEKLFSKNYVKDENKFEDKPKFRARLLKFIQDFTRPDGELGGEIQKSCRAELGFDLQYFVNGKIYYQIEETFSRKKISDILDFLTIVYDSIRDLYTYKEPKKALNFLKQINRIFSEESMCYYLNENGRARYFPDEQFKIEIEAILSVLNSPKFSKHLISFNEVLEDFYKNKNKESPIRGLFDCVETFVLSLIQNNKFNRLSDASIENLIQLINKHISDDAVFTDNDREIFDLDDKRKSFHNLFASWVTMCHKYRHGKKDQFNKNVPSELFIFIFSTGVSIFRLLLELDKKYDINQT